jgi:hypothetical protein
VGFGTFPVLNESSIDAILRIECDFFRGDWEERLQGSGVKVMMRVGEVMSALALVKLASYLAQMEATAEILRCSAKLHNPRYWNVFLPLNGLGDSFFVDVRQKVYYEYLVEDNSCTGTGTYPPATSC